ncbi:MAG: hypothetical protein OXG34_12980 [bacterium]|nr:hypothetical protein [bacterium]
MAKLNIFIVMADQLAPHFTGALLPMAAPESSRPAGSSPLLLQPQGQ